MSDDKELKKLAEELGISVEALKDKGKNGVEVVLDDELEEEVEAEVEEEEEVEEKKTSLRYNEDNKNKVALKVEGVPANFRGRPIKDGKEWKPNFNSKELEKYRESNGRIVLEIIKYLPQKRGQDELTVYKETTNGNRTQLFPTTNNYSRGRKRAKSWATILELAYNPKKDVEIKEVKKEEKVSV